MKKIKLIILFMVTCIVMTGCSKEFKLNEKYEYNGISFNVSDSLTNEDLSSFYPQNVTTIDELKTCIKDNINTYYITKLTDSGRVNIYFNNEINYIKFTEDECIISINDEEKTYEYT